MLSMIDYVFVIFRETLVGIVMGESQNNESAVFYSVVPVIFGETESREYWYGGCDELID